MNWEKIGYVISSRYRTLVVVLLNKHPKTPSEVAAETGLRLSHVSSTISDLVRSSIVLCLNPKLRRGRIYALTNAGKEIAEYIQLRSINRGA